MRRVSSDSAHSSRPVCHDGRARTLFRMDGDLGLDSRTRFAIGGVSTVVASVAVVCAVALTNSVALVDSAGAPAGAQPVVVPTPSGTIQTDSPTPSAPPTVPSAST